MPRHPDLACADAGSVMKRFVGALLLHHLGEAGSAYREAVGLRHVHRAGEQVPIEPHRFITFNPSAILKARINGSKKKPRPG